MSLVDTLLTFLVGHHLIFYQIFYQIVSCVSMAGPSITSLCPRHLSLKEIFRVMSVLGQLSPAMLKVFTGQGTYSIQGPLRKAGKGLC